MAGFDGVIASSIIVFVDCRVHACSLMSGLIVGEQAPVHGGNNNLLFDYKQ